MGTIEGRHQPQIHTTVPVPNGHRIPNPAKLNNFRSKFKRFGQLCRSSAVTKNFAPVPPPYTNIYGPIWAVCHGFLGGGIYSTLVE
jgi:hypothetical protein